MLREGVHCYYELEEKGLKNNEFGGGGEMYSGHPSNLFKMEQPLFTNYRGKG